MSALLIDDAERVAAIRATFACVMKAPDDFADAFYAALFRAAPSVRSLFPQAMTEQHRKFLDMLVIMVDAAENLGPISDLARNLGKRHVDYGARPEHYGLVRDVLLATMQSVCKEVFDERARSGWTGLLDAFTGLMLEGVPDHVAAEQVPD